MSSIMKLDKHAEQVCRAAMCILREERERKGVTGTRLAEMCGLNQSTVSLLDRGERKPTLDTLVRISTVLEIDLGEILTKASRVVRENEAPKTDAKAKARPRRAG